MYLMQSYVTLRKAHLLRFKETPVFSCLIAIALLHKITFVICHLKHSAVGVCSVGKGAHPARSTYIVSIGRCLTHRTTVVLV